MNPTVTCSLVSFLLVSLATAEPLALGRHTLPGEPPTDTLVFTHPEADRVTIRHSGTDWGVPVSMRPAKDDPGIWTATVEELGWKPGVYEFKFLPNNNWEEGPNRFAYVNADGQLAHPPALYLTWRRDPSTTMIVHWHSSEADDPGVILYHEAGGEEWREARGSRQPFPDTGRFIHTVELTGLSPGKDYVFRRSGEEHTYRFRTLPDQLTRPVRFLQGGDVYHEGGLMDRMNRLAGSLDPDFVVLGGDLAYADGLPEYVTRWFRYFQSFYEHLRAPDGRMIPVVVAIGNHEVRGYYVHSHEDYVPGPAWQLRVAPYFYRLFAMPGLPGYNVLDLGDYASFILLDSGHTVPVAGEQTEWLAARLNERAHVPHLFPVYHVPAYPSVRDPGDPVNTQVREHWVPLFEAAGVRLAFEHHDHALKITHPLKGGQIDPAGIVYLGDGAWSVELRTPRTPGEYPVMRKTAEVNHLFEVTLEPALRTVRTIDIAGGVLDVFTQDVP